MTRYFLATTALEDYWTSSHPIIFLGEWCKLYNRRDQWAPLGGETLPSPWRDRSRLIEAYHYGYRLYEHLLPLLANTLNAFHGTSHSSHYWRIILGSWLQAYVSASYDRYVCLTTALNTYPDITTIGLSAHSFSTPVDTMTFLLQLNEDSYNLQFYTRILEALGFDFPRKPLVNALTPTHHAPQSEKFKNLLRRFSAFTQKTWLNTQERRFIILKDSYFSRRDELRLFLKTRGKVWPNISTPSHRPFVALDQQRRNTLAVETRPENEFERLLVHFLPQDIPITFIEGFNYIRKEAQENYPSSARAIFSSNSWHYDETFKQWAAASAEQGALLLGAQHGGNYGSPHDFPSEDHEIAITDKFYTWGWEKNGAQTKLVTNLPPPKLSLIKAIGADNRKDGILLALTTRSRYLVRLPFDIEAAVDRIGRYPRLVAALSETSRHKLTVRTFEIEHGWYIAERWRDILPRVHIETTAVPFLDSLQQYRLYVCDHQGTTYAEALAANKPTILFWNYVLNPLRPEAEKYFECLKTAGILYDSPEAAANAINIVYPDVENWWNNPERQEARQYFCEHFARTAPHTIDLWAKEFNTLLNQQGT